MGRWVPRTAVMRMGCCTSLLYRTTGASKTTVDNLDLAHAREVLDADHFARIAALRAG